MILYWNRPLLEHELGLESPSGSPDPRCLLLEHMYLALASHGQQSRFPMFRASLASSTYRRQWESTDPSPDTPSHPRSDSPCCYPEGWLSYTGREGGVHLFLPSAAKHLSWSPSLAKRAILPEKKETKEYSDTLSNLLWELWLFWTVEWQHGQGKIEFLHFEICIIPWNVVLTYR